MFTLGYSFKPWKETKAIADGASIRRYVEATAGECGVTERIQSNHQVLSAGWSTCEARSTVTGGRTAA